MAKECQAFSRYVAQTAKYRTASKNDEEAYNELVQFLSFRFPGFHWGRGMQFSNETNGESAL